jgi:hypothetical protein
VIASLLLQGGERFDRRLNQQTKRPPVAFGTQESWIYIPKVVMWNAIGTG